jgi:hypothetical protein
MKSSFNKQVAQYRGRLSVVTTALWIGALSLVSACSDSDDAEDSRGGLTSQDASVNRPAEPKKDAGDGKTAPDKKPDDSSDTDTDAGSADDSAGKPSEHTDAGTRPDTEKPVVAKASRYVVASTVFGDDSETSYVYLLSSFENAKLDPKQALELPGRASIASYEKWLFVADGESPLIRRYVITEQGGFKEDGRVSFGAYTSDPVSLDEWYSVFISSTKAYLATSASTDLIIWNPSELSIDGQVKLPELARKGLDLDGSTFAKQGKYVLRAVSWKDWDAYKTSEEQYLLVFDSETNKLVDMVRETRCPALSNRVDADEQGNLYFSNWIYNVTETLVAKAPHSCALRVKAGERSFDKDWILEYPKLTQDREAAGFNYLKDGHGFLSVFHSERVKIDAVTDPSELARSDNWRLWSVDVKNQTAKPVESLDFAGGGYTLIDVDGHTLLTQSTDDYARTSVYEVTSSTELAKRFDLAGFSYQIVPLY